MGFLGSPRIMISNCQRSVTRILQFPVLRIPRSIPAFGHRLYSSSRRFLKVSDEVQDAVATGKPVVALETTIYTHGFPYPDNAALASRLEQIVRQGGGVPATIGVLNGVARVGLDQDELTELAASSAQGKQVIKLSRRDLGYICGLGLSGEPINGGTTIAGTMVLAHLAGIKVFATGGLGGVHRGAESSMDISADLTELGRTPVAVISSGCKSFLDIPRTLEYLETEGVLVGAFADGRTGRIDFPAFFSRESGIPAPRVIRDEYQAAAIIHAQFSLPVSSGMLFANPVPEKDGIPKDEMDVIIAKAVALAEAEGARGSDNTPFILAKIRDLSGGRTIATNWALVESNVARGTRVAVELAKLEAEGWRGDDRESATHIGMLQSKPGSGTQGKQLKEQSKIEPSSRPEVIERADVVVAGALAVDFSCDYTPLSKDDSASPTLHTSNPSSISQSFGGVGHNVALAASYAGSKVLFCSAVANDLVGRAAMEALDSNGISGHGVLQLDPMATGARTAQYIAVNDTKKDLLVAMADMSIMELPDYKLDFEGTWKPLILQSRPSWAVVDANWSPRALSKWIALCKDSGISVAIEPVSVPKSRRLFSREAPVLSASRIVPNHVIDLATPNQHELAAMHAAAREAELFDSPEWWQLVDALNLPSVGSRDRFIHLTSVKMVDEGIPQQSIQMLPFIPCIITKLGPQGVLLTQLLSPDDPRLTSPDSAPYILTRSMASDTPVGGVYMRLFRPAETIPDGEIMSVNGAGDALLGTIVSALATGVDRGTNRLGKIVDILGIAQKASIMTLRHQGGVSPEITKLARSLQAL